MARGCPARLRAAWASSLRVPTRRREVRAPVAVALTVTLSATAVLLPAVATAPATAAAPAGCETAQRVYGPFRSVAKPADLLPGPLVAHAVEPAGPRTVYLADPRGVASYGGTSGSRAPFR